VGEFSLWSQVFGQKFMIILVISWGLEVGSVPRDGLSEVSLGLRPCFLDRISSNRDWFFCDFGCVVDSGRLFSLNSLMSLS
jgi:hypothetical protein